MDTIALWTEIVGNFAAAQDTAGTRLVKRFQETCRRPRKEKQTCAGEEEVEEEKE